jgi:hypothetical protein
MVCMEAREMRPGRERPGPHDEVAVDALTSAQARGYTMYAVSVPCVG